MFIVRFSVEARKRAAVEQKRAEVPDKPPVRALRPPESCCSTHSPAERRSKLLLFCSGAILERRRPESAAGHGVRLSLQIHHHRRYRYSTPRAGPGRGAGRAAQSPVPAGRGLNTARAGAQRFRSVGVNDVVKRLRLRGEEGG